MFRSRIFGKIYLAFALLVVVTAAATGFLAHRQLRSTLLENVEERLRDMATALVPYATGELAGARQPPTGDDPYPLESPRTRPTERRAADVQETIVELGRQTGTRITLIDHDGVVVADSDGDPVSMDNHGTRPEVVAARSAPYGVSRRLSPTLRQSLLYVAVAARDGDRLVGTVRTSIPLVQVEARLASLRNNVALGAAIGFLVAMAAGLFVAGRITAPVRAMTEVADALRAGEYTRRVGSGGNDEFALLGATLDRLADELTARIGTLAGQRAQLGAMMASLHEAVFAIDKNHRSIFVNDAARRLFRLGEDAAADSLWKRITNPELVELCGEAERTASSARREITMRTAEEVFAFDARATSFEAEGERGVVVVLHDVTNLRRLERIRTEFVANVSHELKTPLTSIRGYVDTLINGAVNDKENNLRFLGKIEDQIERLNAMVSDVLELARIEATDSLAATRLVDWRDVVESVVERLREGGAFARHDLVVELPSVPASVAGDVESMTRLLENLLDNAVKYTPAGGAITLRVDCRERDVVLEVEDTGIGISTADQGRIFERFYRADRARSRDSGGTGLGLAIAKHLAQSLGGDLSVDSELGRGSRFVVVLPRPAAT